MFSIDNQSRSQEAGLPLSRGNPAGQSHQRLLHSFILFWSRRSLVAPGPCPGLQTRVLQQALARGIAPCPRRIERHCIPERSRPDKTRTGFIVGGR